MWVRRSSENAHKFCVFHYAFCTFRISPHWMLSLRKAKLHIEWFTDPSSFLFPTLNGRQSAGFSAGIFWENVLHTFFFFAICTEKLCIVSPVSSGGTSNNFFTTDFRPTQWLIPFIIQSTWQARCQHKHTFSFMVSLDVPYTGLMLQISSDVFALYRSNWTQVGAWQCPWIVRNCTAVPVGVPRIISRTVHVPLVVCTHVPFSREQPIPTVYYAIWVRSFSQPASVSIFDGLCLTNNCVNSFRVLDVLLAKSLNIFYQRRADFSII